MVRKSDIENRAMIGGIFNEFVQRVHKHYIEVLKIRIADLVSLSHSGQ
jgi:hypothetical protein